MSLGYSRENCIDYSCTISLYTWMRILIFVCLLRWLFIAVHGLSLVASSGGYSVAARGLLRWLLLLRSMGSRHVGFSSCDLQAQ